MIYLLAFLFIFPVLSPGDSRLQLKVKKWQGISESEMWSRASDLVGIGLSENLSHTNTMERQSQVFRSCIIKMLGIMPGGDGECL